MKKVAALLFFVVWNSANAADGMLINRLIETKQAKLIHVGVSALSQTGTFDQSLVPAVYSGSTADPRTFKERFVVDSTKANGPSSPVIYYMCGEGSCFDASGNPSFPPEVLYLADHFSAYIVQLEHRYFGLSQPFDSLTTEHLAYLKTEYAIEDMATFQKYLMKSMNLTGKWFAVGGSYSGALSAFYRLKHPELASGSLASSAPVEAVADFQEYDHFVAKGLPASCLLAVQGVVHQVEGALGDAQKLADMKALFGASAMQDNIDFLGVLSEIAGIAVQYGLSSSFCQKLAEGGDPVAAYAEAGKSMFEVFDTDPISSSPQGAMSTDLAPYTGVIGWRQWSYLTCTEFGFFSTSYKDPKLSAQSSLLNLDYNHHVCERLFGITPKDDLSATNALFYQPLLSTAASQIFFTNGTQDPWSSLSITHERGNDTNPLNSIFAIEGGSHCTDLGQAFPDTTPGSSSLAVSEFSDLITKWLGQ
jgi:pimeloyl-ACP methyl ester carboxylesterase